VVATIAALVLVNAGLAGLIAFAVGARSLAPLWVLLGLVAVGAAATLVAVAFWRAYLACVRR